jgi:hypothetical protein
MDPLDPTISTTGNHPFPGQSTPAPGFGRSKKRRVPKRRRAKVGKEMGAIRDLLVKTFGADPEKVDAIIDADLEKAGPITFAERMAQRELDNELPEAMSVLRSCIFWAFNPPPDAADVDPKKVISESLDQFKTWALSLVDRTSDPVAKAEVQEQVDKALDVEKAVVVLAKEGYAARVDANPEAPKSDSATVGDVELADIIGTEEVEKADEDRIADLEESVTTIAKAVKQLVEKTDGNGEGDGEGAGDGSGSGSGNEAGDGKGKTETVTKAQLEEKMDEIVNDATEKITELQEQVAKLAEGGSSQREDEIAKAEQKDSIAKAMEAEGFKAEDAAALGGIFN